MSHTFHTQSIVSHKFPTQSIVSDKIHTQSIVSQISQRTTPYIAADVIFQRKTLNAKHLKCLCSIITDVYVWPCIALVTKELQALVSKRAVKNGLCYNFVITIM